MSRKRSIHKIRGDDDDDSSSQSSNTSSRRRNRSIPRLIDEEDISTFRSSNTPSGRRISRSIDDLTNEENISTSRPSTSRNTGVRYQDSQSSISDTFHQFGIQDEMGESSTSTSTGRIIEIVEHESDDEHQEDVDSTFLPRRRVRTYTNRPKSGINPSDDPETEADQHSESLEFTTEEDYITGKSEDDDISVEDDFEKFEDYAPSDYEPFQNPPNTESIDNRFLWILLWIMSFRTRFNITESATEALIKFMKLVLTEIRGDEFRNFPNSIYLTKKALGLNDRFHHFVSCSKCHKLYQKQEVVNFQQNNMPTVM